MTLPLEGVRILDSAHQYPGPYCTVLLADIGAEVLKVERTGSAGSLETLQERQRVSLNYVDREVRIAV